jgi:hypothetical protein
LKSPDKNPDQIIEHEDATAAAEENLDETSEQQHVEEVANAQLNAKARVSAPSAPTGDQLATTRAAHWHQEGQKLLTIEALREWLQRSGLVLYMPRPQIGAPAPSWVEATLGKAEAAPEVGITDAARTLLARLIAEGAAVPLNLLGTTGGVGTDVPDFVASAAVFSYIFTLRGNKAWKQPPVTAGAVKVSPLALAAYEMLATKVSLSAYDLATQLGKEVTEGAVLRALTELWSQLRVIPVPQWDGAPTLWELASARFTKQIKAGANAGQPSALSALITLYLGQAMAATEDEIESFLSPLAPRSRVRDVIHALMAGRQLETLVVKGKTLLHVTGDLPVFAAAKVEETPEAAQVAEGESGSRISKFAAKPGSKIGTGLRSKPAFARKPFGAKPSFGAKPAYGKPAGDRERRPFVKREDRPARPSFDKPWEEKAPRFERPSFERPSAPVDMSAEADSRPPRREFPPREGAAPRKAFSKPGTFSRKREGFSGKPSFGRSSSSDRSDSRPPRRDFADRGERPAAGGFKRPGSYSPRPSGDRGSFGGKPSFGPKRDFGGKPSFGRSRPDSAEGGEAPRKVFRKFDAPRSPKPFGAKPSGGKFFGSKTSDRPDRPSRSFDSSSERPRRTFDSPRPPSARPPGSRPPTDRPYGDRPRPSSDRPRAAGAGRPSFGSKPGGFAGKSGKSFGDKKPFGKPGGFSKPAGPFAKFADGKKPFRKPGPGKKTERPSSSAGGGYRPTKRKRPEDESAE